MEHPRLGQMQWDVDTGPDGSTPELLFCDNETNAQRAVRVARLPRVPQGRHQRPCGDRRCDGQPGSDRARKCAAWYQLTVEPGADPGGARAAAPARLQACLRQELRQGAWPAGCREADEFYAEVIPATATDDERLVARQAFAGMIWGKQFYAYDVRRWLDGDPTQPAPPPQRRAGRNAGWTHMDARDILSMPDPWEYPWFAAWDLAFHTIALAHSILRSRSTSCW